MAVLTVIMWIDVSTGSRCTNPSTNPPHPIWKLNDGGCSKIFHDIPPWLSHVFSQEFSYIFLPEMIGVRWSSAFSFCSRSWGLHWAKRLSDLEKRRWDVGWMSTIVSPKKSQDIQLKSDRITPNHSRFLADRCKSIEWCRWKQLQQDHIQLPL